MHRIVLPLLLALYAGTASAVQDCEIGGEPVNPANGATTEGKSGIMRCRDRDSGQPTREEELRGGKFVGLVRYYKDGRLEREFSVNDRHNVEGRLREFHPDGRLAREAEYRDGKIVGASRSWHANGALKRVAVRGEDGRDAAWAEFNAEGGLQELRCAERPMMGGEVDDAMLCGHGARTPVTRELFSAKGAVRGRVSHIDGRMTTSETLWDNGKPQEQREFGMGIWMERIFSREGIKRRETRWTAAGSGRTKEAEQEFHEGGALIRERRWQAGDLASDRTWYLNGQLKTDYRYAKRDGQAVCEAVDYHDNGKRMREGTYAVRNGYPDRPLGTQRTFDSEGRPRTEREYDANGRLARERQFDENGNILRDDAVFEDGSRKAFAAPAR